MNLERLKQVIEQIEAHPETWDQSQWHCGAKHCLGGWAQLLSGKPEDSDTARRDARIWLDLSLNEADYLFSHARTLKEFKLITERQDGYDRAGYDRAGYDRAGYNRSGYDRAGYDRAGYDQDGYNRAGYDQDGYDQDGYDQAGYDRAGYDRAGYDRAGYDQDGYDQDGLDINNTPRPAQEKGR